jgi:hypothetical protein
MAEDFGATLSFDLSRPGRIGALLPLAFFCALALLVATACGGGSGTKSSQSPTAGDMTVDQAKAFAGFTLYWLGDTYQGLPLTKIHHDEPTDVRFIYGTCTTEDPSGSCNLPLELIEQPNCAVVPDMIATEAKQSSMFKIRGADALAVSGGIVLWTADVSITIFNDTDDASVERLAAQSLMPINGQNIPSSAPLPATITCGSSTPPGPP